MCKKARRRRIADEDALGTDRVIADEDALFFFVKKIVVATALFVVKGFFSFFGFFMVVDCGCVRNGVQIQDQGGASISRWLYTLLYDDPLLPNFTPSPLLAPNFSSSRRPAHNSNCTLTLPCLQTPTQTVPPSVRMRCDRFLFKSVVTLGLKG